MTDSRLEEARKQGQAQFDSMRGLVAQVQDSEDDEFPYHAIHDDPLSVRVRSGWYEPGKNPGKPEEFEILLCTGGPAVRLLGTLDAHCQPDTATLQIQDWFEPWTDFTPVTGDGEQDVLLAYARCFFFGD